MGAFVFEKKKNSKFGAMGSLIKTASNKRQSYRNLPRRTEVFAPFRINFVISMLAMQFLLLFNKFF
jgi:hypothetical protein